MNHIYYDRYEYNPDKDDIPESGDVIISGINEMRTLAHFDIEHQQLLNKLKEGKYLVVDSLSDDFNFQKQEIIHVEEIKHNAISINIKIGVLEKYFEIYRGYCHQYNHNGWYVYDDDIEEAIAINSLEVYN